jgi:hypothetical protein
MIQYLRSAVYELKLKVVVPFRIDVLDPILEVINLLVVSPACRKDRLEEWIAWKVLAPEHCPKLQNYELQVYEWIEQQPETSYSITSFHSFLGLMFLIPS